MREIKTSQDSLLILYKVYELKNHNLTIQNLHY